jgi:probable F420-dependent oxidoreductase
MSATMRFGFTLPNNWGIDDVGGVVDLAVRAEDAGFASVWVNHHLLNVGYVADRLDQRPYYDALTVLTWVAARTSRVRLGTSVLVIAYLNPFVLAKALATLDHLSGGRVQCGVGVGSLPEENAAVGVVDYRTRGAYADEFLEVMRRLWTDPEPSFEGRFFDFPPVKASPKPRQHPHVPIVVGGNSPPALRRAARCGAGWHAMGLWPDGFAKRLAVLDGHLAAAERSRDEVTVSLRADLDLRDGPPPEGGRPLPLTGTADQLVERLEAYREAGVAEVVVSVASGDLDRQQRQLDAFARQVLPRFT